jgi:hypothetical protein
MQGKLNRMLSDGFVEALWESIIALATAAGICVSVISLAAHLNETRTARSEGGPSIAAGAPTAGITGLNSAPSTISTLN